MMVLKNVNGKWRLFCVLECIGLSFVVALVAVKMTDSGTSIAKHDGADEPGGARCGLVLWTAGCSIYEWRFIAHSITTVTACALLSMVVPDVFDDVWTRAQERTALSLGSFVAGFSWVALGVVIRSGVFGLHTVYLGWVAAVLAVVGLVVLAFFFYVKPDIGNPVNPLDNPNPTSNNNDNPQDVRDVLRRVAAFLGLKQSDTDNPQKWLYVLRGVALYIVAGLVGLVVIWFKVLVVAWGVPNDTLGVLNEGLRAALDLALGSWLVWRMFRSGVQSNFSSKPAHGRDSAISHWGVGDLTSMILGWFVSEWFYATCFWFLSPFTEMTQAGYDSLFLVWTLTVGGSLGNGGTKSKVVPFCMAATLIRGTVIGCADIWRRHI